MKFLNKLFRGESGLTGFSDDSAIDAAEETVEGELALGVYQTQNKPIIKYTLARF